MVNISLSAFLVPFLIISCGGNGSSNNTKKLGRPVFPLLLLEFSFYYIYFYDICRDLSFLFKRVFQCICVYNWFPFGGHFWLLVLKLSWSEYLCMCIFMNSESINQLYFRAYIFQNFSLTIHPLHLYHHINLLLLLVKYQQ